MTRRPRKVVSAECHGDLLQTKGSFPIAVFPIRGPSTPYKCVVKSCQCGLLDCIISVTRSGVNGMRAPREAPVELADGWLKCEFQWGPCDRSSWRPDPLRHWCLDQDASPHHTWTWYERRGGGGERAALITNSHAVAISYGRNTAEVALVPLLLLDC